MTRGIIAAMVAVAGLGAPARGQAVLRFLVSTDGGATWWSGVSSGAGDHVDVLATVSYTGTAPNIAGFCAADFQPVISSWQVGAHPDRLSAIPAGGNLIGGMINAQSNSSGAGTPNPYLI